MDSKSVSKNDEDMTGRDNAAQGPTTNAHDVLWFVWRQDDNGNVFLVKDDLTEADAMRLMEDLESKGHEQTYWVRKDQRVPDPALAMTGSELGVEGTP